jgi:hypothetical protein
MVQDLSFNRLNSQPNQTIIHFSPLQSVPRGLRTRYGSKKLFLPLSLSPLLPFEFLRSIPRARNTRYESQKPFLPLPLFPGLFHSRILAQLKF